MANTDRKKTRLNTEGLYPTNPENTPETALAATESPDHGVRGGGVHQEASRPTQPESKPARKRRTQTTIYHNDDDLKRAEAAMTFTMGHTGLRSWTAFVEHAINKYTRELEQEYNDSTPFGT